MSASRPDGQITCIHVLSLLFLLNVDALAAPSAGWSVAPPAGPQPPRAGIVALDVTGDAVPELVFESNGQLSFVDLAGQPARPPVNVVETGWTCTQPLSGADLDGVAGGEVLVVSGGTTEGDGRLMAWRADGRPLWASPVALPGGAAGPALVDDVLKGGSPEIFVPTRDGWVVGVDAKGRPLPGFPVRPGGVPAGALAAGTIRKGEPARVVVGLADGTLLALGGDGSTAPGFPVRTELALAGGPSIGDLDGDGVADIVAAAQDHQLHAWSGAGTRLPGFPVRASGRFTGAPALGDLHADGLADVVAGTTDGRWWLWSGGTWTSNGVGTGRMGAAPLLVDLDRDGADEVLSVLSDGAVGAWSRTGAPLEGFPLAGADASAGLAAVESPRGGGVIVAALSGSGQLRTWSVAPRADSGPGERRIPSLRWPQTGHDAARTGRMGPGTVRYTQVRIVPENPLPGDALRVEYTAISDGYTSTEAVPRIVWTLNQRPVPELDGQREVPGARTRRGQQWTASVRAPEVDPGAATTSSVWVQNRVPTVPVIAVTPTPARVTDALTVHIQTPSTDPDGDAVSYRYRWSVDGVPVPEAEGGESPTLPVGRVRAGQSWSVTVVAGDGAGEAAACTSAGRVENTPPTAPVIALDPEKVDGWSELRVRTEREASDADGHRLTPHYRFTLDRVVYPGVSSRPALPLGLLRRGMRVRAEAWVHDGQSAGPVASVETVVANAAPSAPAISVTPSHPRTTDSLTLGMQTPSSDPDGDTLRYAVRWFRNGKPFGIPGQRRVDGAETRAGDTWEVEVTPSDGQVSGPSTRAKVGIDNSPPDRVRIEATPGEPYTDDEVEVRLLAPPSDPDEDVPTLRWSWTVDGKARPELDGKTRLPPGTLQKHQRARVRVVAADNTGTEGMATETEVRVRNGTPTPPAIQLRPESPTAATGVELRVARPSADRDGDKVVYRTRWLRDGIHERSLDDALRLGPGVGHHGEVWRVEIWAFDGEAEGPVTSTEMNLPNAPPVLDEIRLGPAEATVETGLTCGPPRPPTDPDGDPVSVEYRWTVQGTPALVAADQGRVPGGLLHAGEEWECEAVAVDALGATSGARKARTTVLDALPRPASAQVAPATPRVGQELRCELSSPGGDPDGGPVLTTFRWINPSGQVAGESERLPAGRIRRGEQWTCEVTVTDEAGARASSKAVVEVQNAPPDRPEPRLEPTTPTPGTELRCLIPSPASDPDGDAVSYVFAWWKNGERQSFAETSMSVPARLVKAGDRWRCSAMATDGQARSDARETQEIRVAAPR